MQGTMDWPKGVYVVEKLVYNSKHPAKKFKIWIFPPWRSGFWFVSYKQENRVPNWKTEAQLTPSDSKIDQESP